jgi:O-methyltransferase involved in polyketide biosynthesis
LLASGFDPRASTLWLVQGVLFYLEPSTVDSLLSTAANLSQASAVLAADTFGTGLLRLVDRQPPPFCTDDPGELLRRNGWEPERLVQPGQPAANYGRLAAIPENWSGAADPAMCSYLTVSRRRGA